MKKYYLGYYNKPWNKTDFVVMVETTSEHVANFVKTQYNEAYKANGLSTRLVIEESLPEDHRYA